MAPKRTYVFRQSPDDPNVTELQCSTCHQWKSIDVFSKDRTKSFGITKRCKECTRIASKNKYYTNIDKKRETARKSGKKRRDANLEEFRKKEREYRDRPGVRERKREQGRKHRAKNRDEYNRKKREDRAANPEKYREWQRIWTEKNRARRLEQSRKGTQNYTKTHPIERQVAIHRRRAHKLGLPSTFTADEWRSCLAYWKHCCCICGRPAGFWHTIAIEHWIPLNSKQEDNPGNVKPNVLPLCHGIDGCNNSKGTKGPIEWLIAKFGKRKAKAILKRIQEYFAQLE